MTMIVTPDEMVDGRGGVRPRWRRLLSTISELGLEEVSVRRSQMALALRDLSGGRGDTGDCDPVPLILDAAEFAQLEAGVIQRARVQEAMLRDVYGAREVLKQGILPPRVLWLSNGFLRLSPLGDSVAHQNFLSFYAVDLVREEDGRWSVLADRVSRGNGIGRLLENRRQMARIFPELFAGYEVRHPGVFVDVWQDILLGASGGSSAQVLLTPGREDPYWPEHVILAKELGCTLAEAGDLTVRQGQLWLKTVSGLQKVETLLIRQEAETLDPLELNGSRIPGVAGLMMAVRNGAVRLFNDPRAGFSETAGLLPFMPALTQFFLGEQPLLRTVRTEWGQVMPNTSSSINGNYQFRSPAFESCAMAMDEVQSASNEYTKIAADPRQYVSLMVPGFSMSPSLIGTRLEPRPLVLRLFAACGEGGWSVLPGGLARVGAAPADILRLGSLDGVVSKDVWVLAGEAGEMRSAGVVNTQKLVIRRARTDLPSRVAEDFFWLGRYLEQFESAARILRVVLERMSGTEPSPWEKVDLNGLFRLLRLYGVIEDSPVYGHSLFVLTRTLLTATDAGLLLASLLQNIKGRVPQLADRLTPEMRHFILTGAEERLKDLELCHVRGDDPMRSIERLDRMTERLLAWSATISGFVAENMLRSGGRLFLDLGRRIERAGMVCLSFATFLDQDGIRQRGRMEGALRLMLELCDSAITYRSRYFGVVQPAAVMDLLLLDEDNPRGVGYQLAILKSGLSDLERASQAGSVGSVVEDLSLVVQEQIQILRDMVIHVQESLEQDMMVVDAVEIFRSVRNTLMTLSVSLTRRYFTVLAVSHVVDSVTDETLSTEGESL
ncbi:MAG: circularly permuted type 2 ATP-grasp protein [Acetobacter sp.]|nr:circularly permuted type 2 ATP-grasp protein [Acetobacter sp.]